ncbi:hypothetical protein, partial [Nioella nitratireducens]|uniref:hypothetical protein n=1 Tax=Nioella nitratireducens TaxID=1287720 RepID=UPI001F408F95
TSRLRISPASDPTVHLCAAGEGAFTSAPESPQAKNDRNTKKFPSDPRRSPASPNRLLGTA